jgi:hypothetical protein
MMRVVDQDDIQRKTEEESMKADKRESDPGLQIPNGDTKNNLKTSNDRDDGVRGELSPSYLARSYINIKRHCRPWPVCVVQG